MTEEGRAIEPLGETAEKPVQDLPAAVGPLPDPTLEAGPEQAPQELPEETVEGLPVLAEVRPLDRTPPAVLPAVQTAAAVATGFVAGAATFALVKRHNTRRSVRAARSAPRRAVDMLPIVGSRTFLVDIHLIGKPEE
jgi:hypothetical protein